MKESALRRALQNFLANAVRYTARGSVLLGVRRYVFARPPLLGPTSRTVATGVTIFTGYPFLRGALKAARKARVDL